MDTAFASVKAPFIVPAVPGTIESAFSPLDDQTIGQDTTANEMVAQIIQVSR